MYFASVILLFNIFFYLNFVKCNLEDSSELQIYSEGEEFRINPESECEKGIVKLKEPKNLHCVCVNGIFSFVRKKCQGSIEFLAGKNHCFHLKPQKIKRVDFIHNITGAHSLTILDAHKYNVKSRFESEFEFPNFAEGDSLISVGEWTLLTQDGKKLCLLTPLTKFCHFEKVIKFIALRPGCSGQNKEFLTPSTCGFIMEENNGNDEGCYNIHDIKSGSRSRSKREVDDTIGPQGRVFLSASLAMSNDTNAQNNNQTIDEKDEDSGLSEVRGSPIVKSQIYNYVTEVAKNVIEKGSAKLEPKVYKTPAYQVLELCKDVMAKTCPSFYVPPSHWDMAVSSFIGMHQKSFRFRETFIDLVELKRIKKALIDCLMAATVIPFIPQNETCVNGTALPIVFDGTYQKFDSKLVVHLDMKMSSRFNEPIVESVWKIFLFVHSYCYDFFKTTRYNDHHTFTSLLMPLFTNDIWDVWTKDDKGEQYKLEKDVYAGLLGDGVRLMDNVDYCAWYGRLDSTYPWDLKRPEAKIPFTPNGRRKKRSTPNSDFAKCATDNDMEKLCT